MKSTVAGVTTAFIGDYYEWRGSAAASVKYYYAGGVRVAMCTGGGAPKYLLGDHLGSTSVLVNEGGADGQEQGYMPWGETRYGGVGTEYQYTGQYRLAALGLDYYGARWYDPSLGRWAQADSVIPGIRDTLAWDRYAYSFNNPIKYTDPSGHDPELLEFLMGAATQFTNDMTLGLVDEIANTMGVCLDCDASSAYEAGEKAGRAISSVVSATEFVMGVEAVAAGAAVIPPTVAVGASCTAGTGGACAAVALPVVGVEAVTVIAGMGVAVHGGMTIAYIKGNPVGQGKAPKIIQYGGNTLNKSTLEKLGLTKGQGKSAIEALKKHNGIGNDFHGYVAEDGSYIDPQTGKIIDNLYNYLP